MTEQAMKVPEPPATADQPAVPLSIPVPTTPTPAAFVAEYVLDVGCPGCGSTSRIDAGKRVSDDFCPNCDYPLFWAVERVNVLVDGDGDSLRRLPGTVGRTALASLRCPVCTEPNIPSAVYCVRCGSELDPAPVVEYVPPPEPVAAVIAQPDPIPWWAWAVGVLAALLIIAGIVTAIVA